MGNSRHLVGVSGKAMQILSIKLRSIVCSSSIVLIFVLSAGQIWAAEPSLEKTIEYIDAKFSACGSVELTNSRRYSDTNNIHEENISTKTRVKLLESDRIVFTEEITKTESSRHHSTGKLQWGVDQNYTYRGEVSLRNLATDVAISKYGQLIISCSKSDCINVTKEGWSYQTKDLDNPYDYDKYSMDEEIVASVNHFSVCEDFKQRILKAFVHAIKISGGKDELF